MEVKCPVSGIGMSIFPFSSCMSIASTSALLRGVVINEPRSDYGVDVKN